MRTRERPCLEVLYGQSVYSSIFPEVGRSDRRSIRARWMTPQAMNVTTVIDAAQPYWLERSVWVEAGRVAFSMVGGSAPRVPSVRTLREAP
jgi:hypothetical protein